MTVVVRRARSDDLPEVPERVAGHGEAGGHIRHRDGDVAETSIRMSKDLS